MAAPSKTVKEIIDAWQAAGCTVRPGGSGHFAVLDRDGRRVATIPSSPSDRRVLATARSELRRYERARSAPQRLGELAQRLREARSAITTATDALPPGIVGGEAQRAALAERLDEVLAEAAAVAAELEPLRNAVQRRTGR